jgi:hypothetical protein
MKRTEPEYDYAPSAAAKRYRRRVETFVETPPSAPTDGNTNSLASDASCPVGDPGAATEIILRRPQIAPPH